MNATQIIVGAPRHGRLAQLFRPSTANAIVADSGDIDVHVVTHPKAARTRSARAQTGPRPRRLVAWIAAVAIPCALAAVLLPWRDGLALSTVLLIFLLGVIGNALIGGVAPAAAAAVIAGLLANYLYTPPIGSLTITEPGNVFALAVFIVVGVTVASIVDRSAIRARQAIQGKAEAQLVAAAATSVGQLPQPRARRAGTGPHRIRHDLGRAAGQGPHRAEHLPAHRRRRHTRRPREGGTPWTTANPAPPHRTRGARPPRSLPSWGTP